MNMHTNQLHGKGKSIILFLVMTTTQEVLQ